MQLIAMAGACFPCLSPGMANLGGQAGSGHPGVSWMAGEAPMCIAATALTYAKRTKGEALQRNVPCPLFYKK